MTEPTRKSVIVTFKKKDQRPDKGKDKREIFSSVVSSEVTFYSADDFSRGQPVPSAMPPETIGYDVNRYGAPILMARLTEKEIDSLQKNDNVAAVEDDGPCWAAGHPAARGNLVIEGQPSIQAETIPAGIAQIRAPEAWDASRGKAVKVAVLDTGIDNNHPDLKDNFRLGVSFVPTESSSMDYNSHGTHVAGTIGATFTGAGVVGVAPAVYLYAVKVLDKTGNGQWSWLIAGLDWVLNKKRMHVANMSLTGSGAPAALKQMCDTVFNGGVLLVAAAGNAGGPVEEPAKYDSVIAVSNIDSTNVIYTTSCRGPEIELCAPGVNVYSTLPGGGYGYKTGTSMAAPHVSGAAALAWGTHRYSDNKTIRRLLAWRANNLGTPGRDNLYGFGRVDAESAAVEFAPPPAIPGLP